MYWLGSLYWLSWVALALLGAVFGAWYQWAKSREEMRDRTEGIETGPIDNLLRALDEHRRYLLTAGEDLGGLRNEIGAKDVALAGLERQLTGRMAELLVASIELQE